MGGSQKSKKVTWASDVNLCQVRLFLSEDSPSQAGMGTQDHLQAKALQSGGGMGPDDNLPPGFEGMQPAANLLAIKLSQIPLVKWKCPPRFEVNSDWNVVAGEESRETEAQDEREMRMLEAIYPRSSAIPPNPSALVPMGEDSINNDQNTPVVPVTPIEDEDSALDNNNTSNPVIIPQQQQQPQKHHLSPHGNPTNTTNNPQVTMVGPDIVAAAQAALTSVMSNNNSQGNLIDHDLLVKILSDPKMIEQLVSNHGSSSGAQTRSIIPHTMPAVRPQQTVVPSRTTHNMANIPNMPSTSSQYIPGIRSPTPNSSFDHPVNNAVNRREPIIPPPSRPMANGPFYPPTSTTATSVGPAQNLRPPMGVGPGKDMSYYKSLIQQHGGERRDSLPQFASSHHQQMGTNQEMVNREYNNNNNNKPKINKPCMYFNSARGCRNGANCAFQHDSSSQQRVGGGIPEVQSAKRVKLDREITGT